MSKVAPCSLRFLIVSTLATLILAGCATDHPTRGDAMAPPAEEKTPEMEGHAVFLNGQLIVDVVLNRAGFAARGERGGENSGRGDGRGLHGGFGGGRGRRGGAGGGFGENRRENAEGEPAVHITASNLPPVRLHLRFTNTTGAAMVVEVPQFDSDLGNFVVQPAHMTVPANNSADADPMTSRLGVPADQVPITMTVRVNGATEHEVVFLNMKPAAALPAAP